MYCLADGSAIFILIFLFFNILYCIFAVKLMMMTSFEFVVSSLKFDCFMQCFRFSLSIISHVNDEKTPLCTLLCNYENLNFQVLTAFAFSLFAQENIDIAVIEVSNISSYYSSSGILILAGAFLHLILCHAISLCFLEC